MFFVIKLLQFSSKKNTVVDFLSPYLEFKENMGEGRRIKGMRKREAALVVNNLKRDFNFCNNY